MSMTGATRAQRARQDDFDAGHGINLGENSSTTVPANTVAI
jgi:hypothetical protein